MSRGHVDGHEGGLLRNHQISRLVVAMVADDHVGSGRSVEDLKMLTSERVGQNLGVMSHG